MAPTLAQDRRVSGVPDRRSTDRGGRRATDQRIQRWCIPVIPCEACFISSATLFATVAVGRMFTLEYHCSECGHYAFRES